MIITVVSDTEIDGHESGAIWPRGRSVLKQKHIIIDGHRFRDRDTGLKAVHALNLGGNMLHGSSDSTNLIDFYPYFAITVIDIL